MGLIVSEIHRYVGNKIYNRYGVGTGRILLDDVHCNGNERTIDECSHSGWGVHNCQHREDVAISCIRSTEVSGMSLNSVGTVVCLECKQNLLIDYLIC